MVAMRTCVFICLLFSVSSFSAGAQSGAAPARAARPAAASGSFTVNQLGHAVGTAEFRLAPAAGGSDSTSTVRVSMQGLDYALSKTEQLDTAYHLAHVVL